MVKRVFAIIGIVLGAVTAFVGAVVGVMALQGKFKTPQVYPKILSFENSEQVIVSVNEKAAKGEEIFSYQLTATNEDEEYPVNYKTCYVWFVNNVGANLIELCDAEGNLLVASNGRYQINANEPAYYKVKGNVKSLEFVEGSDKNGKVVLQARSENEKVQSNQLTIWIDREIDEVYLNDGQEKPAVDDGVQKVQVGTGKDLVVDYVVNPKIARQPISIENPKEIELYFCGALRSEFDSDDYIKVDATSIVNNETLSKLFYYDDNQLKFKSEDADTYSFKIATFKSYEAKTNFLANPEFVALKNYDKLGKTDYLTVQDLKIEVVNSRVELVQMISSSVVLNLFSQNDYVTLNGTSGINGAKDNNLEITMFDSENEPTNVRYNEVTFGNSFETLLTSMSYDYLKTTDGDKLSNAGLANEVIFGGVQSANVYLDSAGKYQLVDNVTAGGKTYYCTNGACVYDSSANLLKLLPSGSYLDFFIFDGTKYTLFDYSNETFEIKSSINSLGNKSWNVISKKALEEGKKLEIGILVVNSEGEFKFDNFFSSSPVTVAETDLNYEMEAQNFELAMVYDTTAVDSIRFSELKFEDIASISSGTYDNCVFVTENKDGNIDVIEQITYIVDETRYYLVGYIENEKFVNRVRVKAGSEISKDSSTNIYMLQLLNDYPYDENGNKISTEDYITKNFIKYKLKEGSEEFELDENGNKILETATISKVKKLYAEDNNKITIKPSYNLENLELEFKYTDETHYETIEGYKLKITAKNGDNSILEKTFNFYKLSETHTTYLSSSNSVVQITGVEISKEEGIEVVDGLLVKFDTGECLSNPNTEIYIYFSCVGINLDCGPIYVKSISPETIVLNYSKDDVGGEVTGVELSDMENAVEGKPYINIAIDWNETEYKETWTLKNADGTLLADLSNEIFNSTTADKEKGFQDKAWKGKSLSVSYESGNLDIFTIDEDGKNFTVKNIGSTYLKVIINESSQAFIKINVEENGNFKFINSSDKVVNDNQTFTSNDTSTDLNSLVNLGYSKDGVLYTPIAQNLINVEFISSSDYKVGTLYQKATEDDKGLILYEKGEDAESDTDDVNIVSITYDETNSTWKITRINNLYTTFTLQLKLDAIVGDLTFNLELSSSLNVDINDSWLEGNVAKKLYLGTTVQIYEATTDTFSNDSLIRIKSDHTLKDLKVSHTINTHTDTPTETGESLELDSLGEYVFYVKVGDVLINSFTFNVVPNVIVEWKEGTDDVLTKGLTSDTDYAFSDLFNLYQIKTEDGGTIVYGYSSSVMYDSYTESGEGEDKVRTYTYRTELEDYSSISFSSVGEDKETILTASSETDKDINIGWIKAINGTRTETLTLKTDDNVIAEKEIEISNKYDDAIMKSDSHSDSSAKKVEEKDKDGNVIKTTYYYTLMAMKNLNPSFIDLGLTGDGEALNGFTLSDVKWGSESILVDGINYIKLNALSQVQENVQLIFTFEHSDGRTLIYATGDDVNITLIPYCLEENNKQAYSETAFDLLDDVFETDSITTDEKIKSFAINGIYDAQTGGNSILASIIAGGELTSIGFISGTANTSCPVKFNAISGDSITVWVEYVITYTDDNQIEYTFRRALTIENKHEISLNYPQNDDTLKVDPTTLIFTSDDEKTNFLNQSKDGNGNYVNVNFEPINIYSSGSTTLRFDIYDEVLMMNRVLVTDRTAGRGSDNVITTSIAVTKVGYLNVVNFANYFGKISTNVGVVTFGPTAVNGLYGYVVLKISTASGNYRYYIVRVQHNTNTNIDSANELVVDDVSKAEDDEKFTFGDLITKINSDEFLEELEVKYDTVSSNLDAYILSATSIDGTTYFGEELNSRVYSSYGSVDEEIKAYTSYTTITLSLIYRSGNYNIYPIGKLTFILQPSVNETPTLVEATETYGLKNSDGLDDGEYGYKLKAELNNDGISADSLFTVNDATLTEVQIILLNNGTEHVKDEDVWDELLSGYGLGINTSKNLTISKYVPIQISFIVEYKYIYDTDKTFVLKVYYTLEALTIPSAISTQTVGVFSSSTDDEGKDTSSFNKRIALSDIFNGYTGGVMIWDAEENEVTSSYYNSSTGLLTFNQTNALQEITLKFELTDIQENGSNVKRDVKFAVQPGVKMLWSNTGVGQTSGNRLLTTATTNFGLAEGSKITISKSQTASGVYKFEFGGSGLIVYTTEYDLTLNFGEDDVQVANNLSYVTNVVSGSTVMADNLNIAKTDSTTEIDETIGFVHLPSARDMQMTISVGENSTILFFTAVATYGGIESAYITKDVEYTISGQTITSYGADYENVKSGDNSITNIYSYLFTNGITPATDLSNGAQITNLNRINVFKLLAEGETTPESITTGFAGIGFNDATNPNYINFTVSQGSPIMINSGAVTFGTVNTATNASVYLSNQTGIENVEYKFQILPIDDGVNFSASSGISGDNYVSYSYDISDVKSYGKETIGLLVDEEASQFYIISLNCRVDGTLLTSLVLKLEYDGTQKIYYFTNGDFRFNIMFDAGEISCELVRIKSDPATAVPNKFDITFTAYGSSGAVLENFHILFFNYDIVPNYDSTQDLTNYAGYVVNLTSGSPAKVKLPAGLSLDLVTSNNESYYQIGSDRIYVTNAENDLFTFNATDKTLTLEPVGENVLASLTFLVKDGSYGIKKVKYNFVVNRNYQFMVNGDYETNTNGYLTNRTEFETNFVLTNKEEGNFPISKVFGDAIASGDNSGTKYKALVFNIYRIRDQYNENSGKETNKLTLGNSIVEIVEMGNLVEDGIITIIGNSSITFHKDYTGDINLMLIVRTNNGEYQVDWTIHVTGILSLEYTLADPETSAVQNSGSPFESLTSVDLTNISSNVGVGIKASKSSVFTSDITANITSADIATKYVIIKSSNLSGTMSLAYQSLVEEDSTKEKSATTSWDAGHGQLTLSTTLPLVESSDPNSPQYYYVIYKITFSYLNKTRDFYVAYQVVNYKSVTANSSYTNVNVNTALTISTYLDLFYYEETYKNAAGTTTKVTLTNSGFSCTDTGFSVDETSKKVKFGTEYCTFVSSKTTYQVLNDGNGDGDYVDSGDININSMFISNFNNIFEFKAYIDEIDSVQIGSTSFTLTHIADGRWGINLSRGAGNEWFYNEISADLKIISNGSTVDSIPAMSNNVGFRLFTNNTISANKEVALSTIFTSSNLGTDKSALSLSIIGISSSLSGSASWVISSSPATPSCSVTNNSVATFNVPTGTGSSSYKLFEIEYNITGGGLSGVCGLKQKYYAIQCDSAKISVIDYYSSGLASADYIQVSYVEGKTTQELDTSKTFKVYSMESNRVKTDGYVTPTLINGSSVDLKITKSSSDLQAYKNEYPTAKTYARETYTATFGGKTVQFKVKFALPSNPTIETIKSTSDWSIDLKSTDYSETFKLNVNGGQSITIDNITAYVTEVVADSDSSTYATVNVDSSTGKWDGTITLKASEIGTYFSGSATSLKLTFTVAMKYEGSTITQTFNVIVKASAI